MFWALPLDDFTGKFCGEGKSPLMNAVKKELGGYDPPPRPTPGPTPAPTKPPKPTKGKSYFCFANHILLNILHVFT